MVIQHLNTAGHIRRKFENLDSQQSPKVSTSNTSTSKACTSQAHENQAHEDSAHEDQAPKIKPSNFTRDLTDFMVS